MHIFYHADDFGITSEQSNTILNCRRNGILNSVSIMPNAPKAEECYKLIADEVSGGSLRAVCHLNFVEGHPLAELSKVRGLINPSTCLFDNSYIKMLKVNYSHLRGKFKAYCKAEIAAQLKSVSDLTGTRTLSIDSHQHYHMIPFIFEALMEVIIEEHYRVDFLRIPADPIKPLLTTPSVWPGLSVKNIVKWGLLSFLYLNDKRIFKKYAGSSAFKDMKIPVFFGMFFTCRMERNVVSALLPSYKAIAASKERDLELMLHPGGIYDKADLLDPSQEDLVEFFSSPYRKAEQKTLLYRL